MKRKILLGLLLSSLLYSVHAQKNKKKITAYAITAVEKGPGSWTEVRLVDIITGEEVKTIYQSKQEIEILNARTGKPIVKKDLNNNLEIAKKNLSSDAEAIKVYVTSKVQHGDLQAVKKEVNQKVMVIKKDFSENLKVKTDKPFATSSAACAYDKKHERLYYTPMGINQLRYIDLNAKTPRIYYFEDEPFGALKHRGDVPNQITRMVIASDGNGYALTNDGNHLIRFTTDKKPVITDLGVVTDDAANASHSVHSSSGYGGDMIADKKGNLYLITANRVVFKIGLDTRVATYLGSIKGLPKGYSTNGAVVEEGSMVIVSSSNSTLGYYKFDLTKLEAEKISTGATVFNASDLANGNLAFEKKKKEKKQRELKPDIAPETPAVVMDETIQKPRTLLTELAEKNNISVYPNPVTNGLVKLAFDNLPKGKYQIQLMDISGKLISTSEVTIDNKIQIEEFKLPDLIAKGNYMVKVVNQTSKVASVNKIIVQ